MPSETTEHNNSLLSFELPLMYIESGRSLVQFVHVVPRPVCPRPAAPRRRRSRTGSQVSLRLLAARTRRVPGAAHDWYLRDIAGARRVDCEAERHPRSRFPSRHGPRNSAGCCGAKHSPGGRDADGRHCARGPRWAFRQFSRSDGPRAVHEADLQVGKLAASAVPPLLDRLGVPLTLDLLRRRITDVQVFGRTQVRTVTVAESLNGVLELDKTFESTPWQGSAERPTFCLTASLEPACNRAW
jgi:hypothetical protein